MPLMKKAKRLLRFLAIGLLAVSAVSQVFSFFRVQDDEEGARSTDFWKRHLSKNEDEDRLSEPMDSLYGFRINGLPRLGNKSKDDTMENSIDAAELILQKISQRNREQVVRNTDKFGPVTSNTTSAVILVQTHNRLTYLRHLISSFGKAANIEGALIIFSHDFWDEEINELIDSIEFARTIQIFYPYSIQTHPDTFPNESPNDCKRDVDLKRAQEMGCVNAEWPDLHGHYREGKFTQIKHHWWWKANRVFNELEDTKDFDGLVLFLEEDHYVSKDFLSVLSVMKKLRDNDFPECEILCLGTYLKSLGWTAPQRKKVEILPWTNAHNMGMAFDRKVWNRILECREQFCSFDDYNWDWSLLHISMTCMKNRLQVMLMKSPRIFHIGECGAHHKQKGCETENVVGKVDKALRDAEGYMFPMLKELIVSRKASRPQKVPKGNGGWGDKRDVVLCNKLSNFNSTGINLRDIYSDL